MIPRHFIDELIRDADLLAIVGRYVKLTSKGRSHVGLCPFHDEKTPSFNVVPDKGFYHCFGCGASGNALSFLMRYAHGDDFVAAVQELAQSMGREVPRQQSAGRRVPVKLLGQMARFYHGKLMRNERAKSYLKGRGITGEAAKRFGLGFAPPDGGLKEALGADADKGDNLVAVGLARRTDAGRVQAYFRSRIMFPIFNTSGKVAGFGGRVLGNAEPKYLNSPQSAVFDKGKLVYGLREAVKHARACGNQLLVVEGYMDVVMLARHGIPNAVATMGTAATTVQLAQIIQRAGIAVFCFDGDQAGTAAAYKVLANIMPVLADGKEARFAFLPQGEDPDSFVNQNGAKKFGALIEQAVPLEQMLLKLPADHEDDSAAQASGRMHRVAELIEAIDRDKAPFLYEELYRQLSAASSISVADLKRAAQSTRSRKSAHRQPPQRAPAPAVRRAGTASNEQLIVRAMACLCAKPELAGEPGLAEQAANLGSDGAVLLALLGSLAAGDPQQALAAVEPRLAEQAQAYVAKWQKSRFDLRKQLADTIAVLAKRHAAHRRKQAMREELKQNNQSIKQQT